MSWQFNIYVCVYIHTQLKKMKEEAKHKVDQWKKQAEEEHRKQEEQRIQALLDA